MKFVNEYDRISEVEIRDVEIQDIVPGVFIFVKILGKTPKISFLQKENYGKCQQEFVDLRKECG